MRSCPYEGIYDSMLNSDCRNCPNYQICIEQKEKKMVDRKQKERKERAKKIKICVSIVLASLAIQGIVSTYSDYKSEMSIVSAGDTTVQVNSYPVSTGSVYETSLKILSESKKLEVSIEENKTEFSKDSLQEEETQPVETSEEETYVEETTTSEEKAEISAYNPSKEYYYNLSEEDMIYIAKVVYKEARGECYEGKVAVAAVVLNRFYSNDSRFNRSSIYSVVTQSSQFASIKDVSMNMLNNIPDCFKAVKDACKGWDPTRKTFSDGAKFFYAPAELSEAAAKERAGIEYLAIGNHNFHNDFAY